LFDRPRGLLRRRPFVLVKAHEDDETLLILGLVKGILMGFTYGFGVGTLCGSLLGWLYDRIVALRRQ
jgi:hypothetical protein